MDYMHSTGFHVDDSEVTLNVCLGKEFDGGELFFRGVRCDKHVNGESRPEVCSAFRSAVYLRSGCCGGIANAWDVSSLVIEGEMKLRFISSHSPTHCLSPLKLRLLQLFAIPTSWKCSFAHINISPARM
jgi:hypothetical protein